MDADTTRRGFLLGGTATAAGLLATGPAEAAQPDDKSDQPKHDHDKHSKDREYLRDRPGPSGPVGGPTDRGKLVPGRRGAGEPVVVPDLPA